MTRSRMRRTLAVAGLGCSAAGALCVLLGAQWLAFGLALLTLLLLLGALCLRGRLDLSPTRHGRPRRVVGTRRDVYWMYGDRMDREAAGDES